ncbi:MAG TPA: glycosyltransferase [Acidimicrobiales bacterium]|nr:glycosyltransferase [Acidimicrobiales bacterium]
MKVTFCSFRLGGHDGVSVEVAKWQRAFEELGWRVSGVAGAGCADRILPGLALDADHGPRPGELEEGLESADLVVVDNVCSIPLNPSAAAAVAQALRGRPAVLRHHDLAWQHARWERAGWEVPTDPAWRHVVINELSRRQLADRGVHATTAYNTFHAPRVGRRDDTRRALGAAPGETLLLHPSRAIARKNVPAALSLAAAVGATYWLTGEAEMGYGPELDRLLARAECRVIRQPATDIADAYAACDAVVFPSTWEGFGNPPVEAAIFRRAAAVGTYPIASELVERFGFQWLPSDDAQPLAEWLAQPDERVLDHNYAIATTHFSSDSLRHTLEKLLRTWGW